MTQKTLPKAYDVNDRSTWQAESYDGYGLPHSRTRQIFGDEITKKDRPFNGFPTKGIYDKDIYTFKQPVKEGA